MVAPVNVVTSSAYLIGVGTVLFNEHLPTAAGLLTLRIAGFAGVAGRPRHARHLGRHRGDAEDDAAWRPEALSGQDLER